MCEFSSEGITTFKEKLKDLTNDFIDGIGIAQNQGNERVFGNLNYVKNYAQGLDIVNSESREMLIKVQECIQKFKALAQNSKLDLSPPIQTSISRYDDTVDISRNNLFYRWQIIFGFFFQGLIIYYIYLNKKIVVK